MEECLRHPLFILSVVTAVVMQHAACAREQIRIVGSSTVYPFAASVAEHFGKAGDFRSPVVESTGTGAGLKLFCEGAGEATPDIADASRRILPEEEQACARQHVNGIVEVKIGYDGIALANSTQGPRFRLTKKQIFLALAREVPQKEGAALVMNPYRRWSQIDPALPDLPIKVYGTPPVSGTRDTFVELVMQKGCAQVAEFAAAYPVESERKRRCQMLREDGAFIEAGENGNLIAQKLIGDPEAIGLFGYSFLDQNTGKIQGSVIDGTSPTFDAIQKGTYSIARPLYFYVKLENVGITPGIAQYVKEFLSEGAIGDEGYLVAEGLVPLPQEERAKERQAVTVKLAQPYNFR